MRFITAGVLLGWWTVFGPVAGAETLSPDSSAAEVSAGEPRCLWYADDDEIRQVDTRSGSVALRVPLKHPDHLVMNAADCGVWALYRQDRVLLRFDARGQLERRIPLRDIDPRLHDADALALDPYDGSLWVADERRLVHLSAEGALLASVEAPQRIRLLAFAHDLGVWALGHQELWRYDAAGTLLASHPVPKPLGEPQHFRIDPFGRALWIAGEQRLVRLDLDHPAQVALERHLHEPIEATALDPYTGILWLAHKKHLAALDRDGTFLHRIELAPLGLRPPGRLAFDPVTRTLWLGAGKALAQITLEGALAARFPVKDGDEALAVPAARFAPTLTLTRPGAEVLTRDPRPVFGVAPGVECTATPCPLPEPTRQKHLAGFAYTGTLNGTPLPQGAFTYDRATAEATYTPSQRLPEGENRFAARATDPFGRATASVDSHLTVDTIPPKFLSVSPADGSVFTVPQVFVEGRVDDPRATVVLEGVALDAAPASGAEKAFRFPVTLQPGPNLLTLTAVDVAGNTATAGLQLAFAPLDLAIESPAPGASVDGDSVLVSGSFQGPANTGITVNGVVAGQEGSRFYATVALAPGRTRSP